MKLLKRLFLLAAVSLTAFAYAQPSSDEAAYSHKLGSPDIWANALAGKAQNLLIELDVGQLESTIARERNAIADEARKKKSAANLSKSSVDSIEAEARQRDKEVHTKLVNKLREYKNAVFPEGKLAGARVIRDFPSSPIVLVEVPNLEALRAVLSMPTVRLVNLDAEIKPAANWPSSYGDITIVKSHITNGVEGKTGKNTRVVILDTAAWLGAIPGWDRNNKDGCAPYSGTPGNDKFYLDQLGIGGKPIAANCRVWSAYNFASSDDYCAAPYRADGTSFKCVNGKWQHGTLAAQVVANTAPGTWVTMLQVYSNTGTSTSSYVTAALDWLIAHSKDEPQIVAANLSMSEDNNKYSAYCPSSVLASRLVKLLENGIVPVVGTGNNGWKDAVTAPACVEGVLSVGATTDSYVPARKYEACSDGTLGADVVPCFSNSHSTLLSMFAPGVDIGSTEAIWSGKSDTILRSYGNGTSYAAPHVAGAVAILRASDAYGSTKSAAQIRDILKNNGTNVTDPRQFDITKKRLDISKALHVVTKLTMSPPTAKVDNGKTLQMTVQATDSFGATVQSPELTFWSTNLSAATVDSKGLVTGKSSGNTVIRVTSGTASAQSTIEVVGKVDPPTDPCKIDPRRCARQSN